MERLEITLSEGKNHYTASFNSSLGSLESRTASTPALALKLSLKAATDHYGAREHMIHVSYQQGPDTASFESIAGRYIPNSCISLLLEGRN
ncbi:hypothetical protein COV20_01720 [Candidatus Woesearchaeota archaeon CG10_big_fil_rev_8_21_14_0_10_45_16]|nr:MAG: hypothetical protein COV20_01720 [Candidatus Woesearchaeota archaeon CG10_big_fil_rev_8_21_14_0_10_45_16]